VSTLHRIEQLTSAFESLSHILRIRAQAFETQNPGKKINFETGGPVEHAHSLRGHIQEIGHEIERFDMERYLPLREGQLKKYGMLANAPMDVAAWSASSRRVYAPTLDAQTILSASKLDGVTWADVQWPFDAFAIELAEPIAGPHGETYDSVLIFRENVTKRFENDDTLDRISQEQVERTEHFFSERGERLEQEVESARERIGNDIVFVRLLGPSLERATVDRKERTHIHDLLREASSAKQLLQKAPRNDHLKRANEKAWRKFWTHLNEIHERVVRVVTPYFPISIERHGDLPVTNSVDELRKTMFGACECRKPNCFRGTDHPELDLAAQLVVGLCLYLRNTQKPERPLVGEWKPDTLIGKIIQRPVTSEAVRCEVIASRTFTQDERDRILGRGKYTQGKWAAITWTAAYNRRPKGQGHDPAAPKSVRIESYPSLHWYSKDPESQEERSSAPIRLA